MKGRLLRWRERERPSLWATPREHVFVLILACTAWLATAQGAVAVVAGGYTPAGDSGLGAVVYTLVALLVAVPSTWLVWAYVRRPVEPPPFVPEDYVDPAPGVHAKEDAERSAWRSR